VGVGIVGEGWSGCSGYGCGCVQSSLDICEFVFMFVFLYLFMFLFGSTLFLPSPTGGRGAGV